MRPDSDAEVVDIAVCSSAGAADTCIGPSCFPAYLVYTVVTNRSSFC